MSKFYALLQHSIMFHYIKRHVSSVRSAYAQIGKILSEPANHMICIWRSSSNNIRGSNQQFDVCKLGCWFLCCGFPGAFL